MLYGFMGDLASRDKACHCIFQWRSDDTIKVSGKRIGPSELESVIVKMVKLKRLLLLGSQMREKDPEINLVS